MTVPTSQPQRLTLPDGGHLAYHRLEGASPGLVFLGGFSSDMTGTKAVFLEDYARARGQAFLRFDYRGHGQSSGTFTDFTIGDWAADAEQALTALTEGPQILIGSSMGGWIMLLVALRHAERTAALAGIAAAPDFTEDLMWAKYPEEVRQTLQRDGIYQEQSDYSEEPYSITLRLVEEGRSHLLLRQPIPITCPVRLLHGTNDTDVPPEVGLTLLDRLESSDATLTLVKDGDHRLSEPRDLARLARTLDTLLTDLASG